ncbi:MULTISPECIES: DUF4422 domain-containing protein [unclassified Facklamia]|uniref:DUF4422 domain-containing protein n=1 Tax=Aerococcaceae TaxID=186827 RepID=UPI0013BD3E3F|nr:MULTISPECIES: DUF4422 domain-containing protein [unclassified Facklamia]MBS4462094.1 DUF4422 domain-containing protein [Aerococcaceae bacterium zg-B36]NEW64558.1 DUF4422 domain-containing protein [Facklamia sp. 252]NEW67765.1 DUF4422 domain-containing protein [Facklamia sp. 253]QQD65740.1 DUF4422 domain-containing protein [Aerococcaceae bacterium zg-252]
MKINILIATHRQVNLPKLQGYLLVQCGSKINDKIKTEYQRDDDGENISELNPYYSELTGLYWAWKNLETDILGLVHYRRFFVKNKSAKELLDRVLDADSIVKLLESKDIVVPKKTNYYIETLESHYSNTLNDSHIDVLRNIIMTNYPSDIHVFNEVMQQTGGYMYNMFIANKKISDEYCEWLFPILDDAYKIIGNKGMTEFEKRYVGRLSELLFNVWLKKTGYSIIEAPYKYEGKINWVYKIYRFLLAKLMKKKYTESF